MGAPTDRLSARDGLLTLGPPRASEHRDALEASARPQSDAVEQPNTTRFLLHFAQAYPGRMLGTVLLLLAASLAEGVSVVTLLPLLELATGEAPSAAGAVLLLGTEALGLTPTFGVLLGAIVLFMTAKGVFRWMAMQQVGFTVVQVATDLRLQLIRALVAARWSYLSGRSTGRLVHAISSEAERASLAYREACGALSSTLQIAIYFAVAALFSWQAALAATLLGGGVVWLLRSFTRMSRQAGQHQTDVTSALIGRAAEVLPGLKPIRSMGLEGAFLRWLESHIHASDAALRRTIRAWEVAASFREPAFVLILALAFYAAVAVADLPFSVVAILAVMLYRVMMAAGDLQGQYQRAVHGESAFWALHHEVEAAQAAREVHTGDKRPTLRTPSIVCNGIVVRHDSTEVLRAATLEIPAGAFVTLVGPSGSGKTTLLDVLTGLITPSAGSVLVDGTPLAHLDLAAWRSGIGYVPQNPLLFHDTIYQNVRAGDATVGRRQVEEALRRASVWPVVATLSQGLDHVVGERGSRLSGGQGQRIALARALVRRPRLLILDEATSALDPAVEADVCEALCALRGEVTIVAASHQPMLQEAADLVYQVDNGRVTLLCDRRRTSVRSA